MYHWYRVVSGDFWFITALDFRRVMYYLRHGYTVVPCGKPREVSLESQDFSST